jgi:hypothetical protein
MKLRLILGAIIFFLGLGSALLGIYAPLPGAEPTRLGIPSKLAVLVIAGVNALAHIADPRLTFLYVGLGTMVVGWDVVIVSLIIKFWSLRKRH